MDTAVLHSIWKESAQQEWSSTPVWLHGDISLGNLLTNDGKLSAVIDFGCCAVGDPACDLAIAWTLFHGSSRKLFREVRNVDLQTWHRGRGWALWKALIILSGIDQNQADRDKVEGVVQGIVDDYLYENAP